MSSSSSEAAAAEKPSSFTQTCNLLCQYLKERGALGDLSLDIACNMQQSNGTPEMFHQKAPTMNFFPVMEKPRNMSAAPREFKSMDLFPQQAGFGTCGPREELPKIADSSVKMPSPGEPQRAPMTIFYNGQVIVFNDFPADKAKELILHASKESTQKGQNHNIHASNSAKGSSSAFASHLGKMPINSISSVPPSSNMFPTFGNQAIQEGIRPSPRPTIGDLPIARKASLHRFLEKRKDRINKVPYQTSSPAAGPAKPSESKSWLEFAAQPTQ